MLAGQGGLRDCLWIVSSNPGFSLDPHTLKQGLDGDPIPVSLSLFKSRKNVLLCKLKFFNSIKVLNQTISCHFCPIEQLFNVFRVHFICT